MPNYLAYYDALSISHRIGRSLERFTAYEVYLFAYLSCLLWLYKKQPVALWGYQFATTKLGHPYSSDIDDSIKVLIQLGMIHSDVNQQIKITEEGIQEYNELSSLTTFSEREPYLEGACSCVLALPVGIIRDGILNEPEISNSIELSQKRLLLNEDGVGILYDQFDILSSTIGLDVEDLMIPSVVWVTYLSEIQKHHRLPGNTNAD